MKKFINRKNYFQKEEVKKNIKKKNKKLFSLLLLLLISIIIFISLKIIKFIPSYNKISKTRIEIFGKNKINQIIRNNSNKNNINEINENKTNKKYHYEVIKNLSKLEQLQSGRKFLDKCLKGILINNNTSDKLNEDNENEILISVVIPVYNCENTIKYAVRSVQNQNVKNIEIILVNDFSNDNNTSKIIDELQNEDKRIRVINNHKNMGILYTRSVGALSSKGKYIFTLDNDDLFFDSDVLEIYKKAENEKYDIIAFSALDGSDYYSPIYNMRENEFDGRKDNIVITQPNLSIYPITKYENSYKLHDPHIWGKCIKNDLYKRAVNALGEERYSVYNCWNEDVTIFLVICTLADNYIFIKKYGIFHHQSKSSAAFSQNSFNLMNTTINLIAIILDFVPNNYKKYAALGAISLRRSWLFNISDINIKKYLNSIINRILDSQFIEQTYKNRVRNTYKGILF